MKSSRPTSFILVWHHRVLGAIWALGGVAVLADLHRAYWWEGGCACVPLVVGTLYTAAGVGFVLGRTWAYWAMAGLIVLAALFFADMILMAGCTGNRAFLHWMLAALGFTAYTGVLVIFSAAFRLGGWHEY